MFKLFSVPEATRLLPEIEGHVHDLQRASRDAADLKRRIDALAALPANERNRRRLDVHNLAHELQFVLRAAQAAKAELDGLGVELTDLEHGSVAIPSNVQGEVVALTWHQGQREITHYRRLTGDATVRPLPGVRAAGA